MVSSQNRGKLCSMMTLLLLGCVGEPSEPTRSDPNFADRAREDMTWEGCQITPGCADDDDPTTPPVDYAGNLHDFNRSTALNEPTSPVDPSPGEDGIWLNLHPQDCYEGYYYPGTFHPDVDDDGLDDRCEFQLARAFAPMIRLSDPGIERCPGGEAYWAAKYFDNIPEINTGDFVRIAYLMSYYYDCGELGHKGDSEFIQLTVAWVKATKHWVLINSWLSAHAVIGRPFGNSILGPVGSNSSTWGRSFQWPSGRRYSYPRVWISINKHANYRSEGDCDNGGVLLGIFEACTSLRDQGRFRVWSSNNIGSAHRPMKDCVASMKNSASPKECFWTGADFGGWQAGTPVATRFLPILNSIVYGCYFLTVGMCWQSRWGM